MFEPRFTICFCVSGNDVLLLRRIKPPYEGKWNGLGGKIEPGETPRASVHREVLEEAGLDLRGADLRYAGVVTWVLKGTSEPAGGMFVYVARFPTPPPEEDRDSPEGQLSWKPLDWAWSRENEETAEIIPLYLQDLLTSVNPREYRLHDEDGGLELRTLPSDFEEK